MQVSELLALDVLHLVGACAGFRAFGFLHVFEPVQILELWVLKPCTDSNNATRANLKAPKPAQAQTTLSSAKPRCNVRGQDFLHCLHFVEPVQVSELSAVDVCNV